MSNRTHDAGAVLSRVVGSKSPPPSLVSLVSHLSVSERCETQGYEVRIVCGWGAEARGCPQFEGTPLRSRAGQRGLLESIRCSSPPMARLAQAGGAPQHFVVAQSEALGSFGVSPRGVAEPWGPPGLIPPYSFSLFFMCASLRASFLLWTCIPEFTA